MKYDALDNCSRVILCNSIRQVMCIIDYNSHEYQSGMWHSNIILYKDGHRCALIVVNSYEEWFIDENHQICLIPQ